MNTVDDLMARGTVVEDSDPQCWIGQFAFDAVELRAALESALKAEYERGRQVGADQEHAQRLADEAQKMERDAGLVAWIADWQYEHLVGGSATRGPVMMWPNPTDTTGLVPLYDSSPKPLSESEQDAEPVAWLESPHGGIRANPLYRLTLPPPTPAWQIPLYASPPKRKPLDESAIAGLWIRRPSIHNGDLELQLRDFARLIERAHGIGDE